MDCGAAVGLLGLAAALLCALGVLVRSGVPIVSGVSQPAWRRSPGVRGVLAVRVRQGLFSGLYGVV